MNAHVGPDIKEVMEALHYRPSVSVILPFQPKVNLNSELAHALKIAAGKVEQELLQNYSFEMATLVLKRLNDIIRELKVDKSKKGIAIYVSPVFEKVVYLDVAVEEKIIIDDSFEIRDLVYSKKQLNKYLLLLLSGKESRMYLGTGAELIRIITDTPETIDAYINEAPERVANFSDTADRKEMLIDKFLRSIDGSLGLILNEYPLPVVMMGTEKILGHFKQVTKHAKSLIAAVKGNYEDHAIPQIKDIVKPYIDAFKQNNQQLLLTKIDEAAGKKKLAVGINEVWRDAMKNKGQLLIVEKNFMYAAQRGASDDVLYAVVEHNNYFSYIKDAVDDILEKVLTNGGDVEFVEEGFLNNYQHIVLINFYS